MMILNESSESHMNREVMILMADSPVMVPQSVFSKSLGMLM